MSSLHVHFLPALVEPDDLRGGTVVVIDVLRATTTIAAAIAAGARQVIPCGEVEEAKQIAAKFPKDEAVLGGERGGLLIPGFDLGNSPRDYTPERVGGKTVVFTTTNGTQAMLRCRQAKRVLTAGFVNASAVANAVQQVAQAADERIHLLCAGTQRQITREDVVLAGCLVSSIEQSAGTNGRTTLSLNDQARLTLDAWSTVTVRIRSGSTTLAAELVNSIGGTNLTRLGLDRDIADSARIDCWDCVPELNLSDWSIRG